MEKNKRMVSVMVVKDQQDANNLNKMIDLGWTILQVAELANQAQYILEKYD